MTVLRVLIILFVLSATLVSTVQKTTLALKTLARVMTKTPTVLLAMWPKHVVSAITTSTLPAARATEFLVPKLSTLLRVQPRAVTASNCVVTALAQLTV